MSTGNNSTVVNTPTIAETSTTATVPATSKTTTSLIETTTAQPTTSTTESIPTPTPTSAPPTPIPPTPTPPTPTPQTLSSTTIATVGVIETSTIDGTPIIITVTVTSTNLPSPSNPTNDPSLTNSATTTTSGTVQTGGSKNGASGGNGLSGGALIAVAVIVPLIVLAVVAVGLVLYFRKRKNKNNAPTKGSLSGGMTGGGGPPPDSDHDGSYELGESDSAGYRGWGSTVRGPKSTMAASSSYPLSSVGKTVSDGGYSNPASAGPPVYSGNPSELYSGVQTPASPVYPESTGLLAVDRAAPSPAFTEASTIGAMPTFDSQNPEGLNRGVSNASSNYSAMTHSDRSDFDQRQSQYYGPDAQEYDAAYFSNGPNMYYDDTANPPPVIRDVQARRHTRIETPTSAHFPQQGSSGIAQNF